MNGDLWQGRAFASNGPTGADIPGQTLRVIFLTLTRPIGLPPHTPVAQKIAEQR